MDITGSDQIGGSNRLAPILYSEAKMAGITIAPGGIFSASGKYRNYVRLNAAFWNDRVELAIETLGALSKKQTDKNQ